MSVDNSHACIPDQMSVQQVINNQTSREEDSAEEVASFCRPVPQRNPQRIAVFGTTWRSAEKTLGHT